MLRLSTPARTFWQSKVKKLGLTYHSPDGTPYWDETHYYSFTLEQIERIEAATNELHLRCLDVVEHVIEKKRYAELGITSNAIRMIEKSWEQDSPSIYGRFDLSYNGDGDPKMLEYNADTPTSLLEAAVVQWKWFEETRKGSDQFNSIHERLVDKWRELRSSLYGTVYFAHSEDDEDFMTIVYLMDTAAQAGLETRSILMSEIGRHMLTFVDQSGLAIQNIFKLYPWEWLFAENFSKHIDVESEHWIEPPWKAILSNKGILALLWELFPNHPNLLPAFFEPRDMQAYVRKPRLSREGANVSIFSNVGGIKPELIEQSSGDYGAEGYVYQEFCPLPDFDGKHPVIGSWVIDGEAAGIGIRESDGLITGNKSRFVPHVING